MKNLILFIFSILVFLAANAQETNYLEYHKNCRKAESYFLNYDTLQCINTYKTTFESFEILFPRDCFMAAQIASKLGQDSMAVEFILKGIPFGLNPEFFSNGDTAHQIMNYKITKLTETKYWQTVTLQLDSLRQIYLKRVDWELKEKINTLMDEDQKLRARCNKTINTIFRPDLEKRFAKLNQKHMIFLDSVFQERGYPGVWLTGIGDSINPITNPYSNNANLSDIFKIILYHNDSVFLNYGEFLYKELKLGHIDSKTYAMICDFNDRHLVKSDKAQKMYYNIWWERNNYSTEEFISHCDEIGCPSKEHLRKLSDKLGEGYDIFWWPFR